MKNISTNVYVDPNVFALFPVIRHEIDIGILEEYPSVVLGEISLMVWLKQYLLWKNMLINKHVLPLSRLHLS